MTQPMAANSNAKLPNVTPTKTDMLVGALQGDVLLTKFAAKGRAYQRVLKENDPVAVAKDNANPTEMDRAAGTMIGLTTAYAITDVINNKIGLNELVNTVSESLQQPGWVAATAIAVSTLSAAVGVGKWAMTKSASLRPNANMPDIKNFKDVSRNGFEKAIGGVVGVVNYGVAAFAISGLAAQLTDNPEFQGVTGTVAGLTAMVTSFRSVSWGAAIRREERVERNNTSTGPKLGQG